MRILFDQNVEPKYIEALEREHWTTTDHCGNHFPDDAPDADIADFAEANDWVVFTRDDDFFRIASQRDCGLLFFHKQHNPQPATIAAKVEKISNAYSNHDNIREGLPGTW